MKDIGKPINVMVDTQLTIIDAVFWITLSIILFALATIIIVQIIRIFLWRND